MTACVTADETGTHWKALDRHCRCGRSADRLCDWKTGEGKTCSRPVCAACTVAPEPAKDLCPTHAGDFLEWQRKRDERRV